MADIKSESPRATRSLASALTIADLRRLARRRLPRAVFDFIDGGAGDEVTLRDNEAAFRDWVLLPRVAVDVSRRSLRTTILGGASELPLMLAPTGLAGFYWPAGEIAAASAAAAAGVPFCLSTNSVASVEAVAKAVPECERWFQLYFLKDRAWMQALVKRAKDAGYRALCITVDLAVQGRRERDVRNAFTMPLRPHARTVLDLARRPRWLAGVLSSPPRLGNFETSDRSQFTSVAQHVATLFDPSASWDDVARFRDLWSGPVVIKGVLHPDDACKAVAIGADAVMVSNHGGRQLDHVPAPISVLPDIVAAVSGRAEVILDGGVRRGTDILKALALGASACSIGRAFLWGLAAGGREGVGRAIAILRDELDNAMTLLGTARIEDVSATHVRSRQPGNGGMRA
ncbi:MAG: alpha-hydroxy-acid oxidizing protein [Candidatus Eremiobacteraeota bacterium]|nr:alpha-hydroxy-acid oxidizing protein [Candidatus Eremiobacteraeota bacterium]